ncbi:MAG TPA: hypothetical protein VGQ57_11125 [Polyangiaceae bacterium]|nr:hypothetical protein [Polyangiaceae bacterium]
MRALRVAVGLIGLGVLALPLAANAQPKGKGVKPVKPVATAKAGAAGPKSGAGATTTDVARAEPTKSDAPTPAEGAPASSGSSASTVTSGDDLGAPPPKPGSEAPAQRRSPLTPEPNEFPQGAPKPPPVAYDKLLSDIAALRGRVAAVTTTLFSSKLRVLVGVEGDDARVASFRVTLDDGVVYSAADKLGADEPQVVYEHAVAPGHHMLGVEIERYDARNREYKTYQASKFAIVVPESKRVEASIRIKDDSDMGDDFPSGQDGEYDLRVRLRARVAN